MNERGKIVLASAVALLGAVVFAITFYNSFFNAPVSESQAPVQIPVSEKEKSELTVSGDLYPSRLIIPAINVDANVQHVGINSKGQMATPDNYEDVGWYKYGTVPGQTGSAVIDGHVDNGIKFPAVFKKLNKLKPGDEIMVKNNSGQNLKFIVDEVVTYPFDQVPGEVLFNRKDAVRLNLITCGGSWLSKEKTYALRVVVYSRLTAN